MPRNKTVHRLKQSCLENIAVHMDTVWVPQGIAAVKEARRTHRNLAGNFDQLPSHLIREILNTLREKNLMKRHYLQFFLVPHLDQLDLSMQETDDVILQLIGNRCKNLKKLVLCWNVTAKVSLIERIVENTPQMTSLNLAGTHANDKTLRTVAKHCHGILELDVSDCYEVTNVGVHYLCLGHNIKGTPCSKLITLNLTGTKVGRDGVICALRKLTQLQYLVHEWLWEILIEMHTQYEPGNLVRPEEIFHLRKMIFLGHFVPSYILRAVDVMCGYCPGLTEVSILGCGFDDQCLFRLSRLKHLKKFHLDDQRNMVTFRWGLLPFLHACGERLEVLSLINVKHVNLAAIALYCPNVEVINLVDMFSTTVTGFTATRPFQHLKRLEMRQHQFDCTSEEALHQLLAYSRGIEYISMYNIVSLTDSVINDILDKNPLSGLEQLSLCRCHGISAETIVRLIRSADILKYVHMRGCDSISYENRTNILNFVKENNFDVEVY